MHKLDWVPARTLRAQLSNAGIGEVDLLRGVAWAALRGRLVATGFQRIHRSNDIATNAQRAFVSRRMWHVFERVDPQFDQIDESAKEPFQRFARWESGEFTWTLEMENADIQQETWEAVHFDRVSLESLIAELSERSRVSVLQDFEIDDWIKDHSQTENGKVAWRNFKDHFGKKSGKYDTFMSRWNAVKERKGRGRLPISN